MSKFDDFDEFMDEMWKTFGVLLLIGIVAAVLVEWFSHG